MLQLHYAAAAKLVWLIHSIKQTNMRSGHNKQCYLVTLLCNLSALHVGGMNADSTHIRMTSWASLYLTEGGTLSRRESCHMQMFLLHMQILWDKLPRYILPLYVHAA